MVASDSLNENQTTVVIHVKDVNDMPPIFDEKSYRTYIDEELPGNYPLKLMQVRVKTGGDGTLIYFKTFVTT